MRSDKLNITYIADSIHQIQIYTQDGREAFMQTRIIQDAVIRNFLVIGEAIKNISTDLKSAHPDVSWRSVAGFRDVLIHNYIHVNLDLVWDIIEIDLPSFKIQIEAILQELEQR